MSTNSQASGYFPSTPRLRQKAAERSWPTEMTQTEITQTATDLTLTERETLVKAQRMLGDTGVTAFACRLSAIITVAILLFDQLTDVPNRHEFRIVTPKRR
jgi:hypothetical protein